MCQWVFDFSLNIWLVQKINWKRNARILPVKLVSPAGASLDQGFRGSSPWCFVNSPGSKWVQVWTGHRYHWDISWWSGSAQCLPRDRTKARFRSCIIILNEQAALAPMCNTELTQSPPSLLSPSEAVCQQIEKSRQTDCAPASGLVQEGYMFPRRAHMSYFSLVWLLKLPNQRNVHISIQWKERDTGKGAAEGWWIREKHWHWCCKVQ